VEAHIYVDHRFTIAPVSPRLFGSFVEHMGRCVYTGLFQPDHPTADEFGFRRDVLDLVRRLGVNTIRYPGGNFVSNYRWEDGIGPAADRPTRLDLAWHSTESNAFGLHEFMQWTHAAQVEPMMAVNLGTRGIQEALDLLEYANVRSGTALSDKRIANGAKEPFDIRMWCLGNELDGPWQVGHKTAAEYGRLAAETARAMRLIDPSLELVACGSSSSAMTTFASWEREVLAHTYELVDFISCHAYYEPENGDVASFLASGTDMDHFIDSVVATADHVGARLKSRKKINVSFDEWNVWYLSRLQALPPATEWSVAPRISEETYDIADAVVVGGLLISLLRHSDRVTAASLAQLVNVIAPISTDPEGAAWPQTTFHPFALTARHARGQVLRLEPTGPLTATERYGEVRAVDAVATWDDDSGSLALFLLNRSPADPVEAVVTLGTSQQLYLVEALTVTGSDLRATNTAEHPDRVVPLPVPDVKLEGQCARLTLPAASWTIVRFGAGG
jgi:alpha-N-arabinofuranosidase